MLKTVQLCPTCSCSRSAQSVCYCRPRQVPGGKVSLTNVMSISSFSSSCGTTSSEKAGEVTLEAEIQKLGSEFKTFIQSFTSSLSILLSGSYNAIGIHYACRRPNSHAVVQKINVPHTRPFCAKTFEMAATWQSYVNSQVTLIFFLTTTSTTLCLLLDVTTRIPHHFDASLAGPLLEVLALW